MDADVARRTAAERRARAQLVSVDTPPPETIRDALTHKSRRRAAERDVRRRSLRRAAAASSSGATTSTAACGTRTQPVGRARDHATARSRGRASTRSASSRASRATTARSSETTRTPVVIDSVGPRVFADKATWDGDQLESRCGTSSSGKRHRGRVRQAGDDEPADRRGCRRAIASLARATRSSCSPKTVGETRGVRADEAGNTTIALVAPFHGQAGAAGCSCELEPRAGAGSLALFGLVGLGLFGRRRRRRSSSARRDEPRVATHASRLVFVGMVGGSSRSCRAAAAASGRRSRARSRTTAAPTSARRASCRSASTTVRVLRRHPAGPHRPVLRRRASADGTIWVSAYAQSHGDLVVAQATGGRIPDEAWEWVDGVPDGPVVVPDSKIRGGIDDDGPDVGMYTSIAVARRRHADGDATSIATPRRSSSPRRSTACGRRTSSTRAPSQIDPGSGGSLSACTRRSRCAATTAAPASRTSRTSRTRTASAPRFATRRRRPRSRRAPATGSSGSSTPRRSRRDPGRDLPAAGRPRPVRRLGAQPAEPGARRRLLRPHERRPQGREVQRRRPASSPRPSSSTARTASMRAGRRRSQVDANGVVARRVRRRHRRRPQVHRPTRRARRQEVVDDGYRIVGTDRRRPAEAGVPLRR